MLDVRTAALTGGVHAVAVWDGGWKSFNNFYILQRDNRVVLVDSGKPGHLEALTRSLGALGLQPASVDWLLATNLNTDHVGNAGHLTRATRAIHPLDHRRLPGWQAALFDASVPDRGELAGLQTCLLGQHTPGSVAFFDPVSRALLVGDHIRFFGDPLPPEGLITAGDQLRKAARDGIELWVQRKPRHQADPALEGYLAGLEQLAAFDAEYLCTGHGPVLQGGIAGFLRELVDIGRAPLY